MYFYQSILTQPATQAFLNSSDLTTYGLSRIAYPAKTPPWLMWLALVFIKVPRFLCFGIPEHAVPFYPESMKKQENNPNSLTLSTIFV